MLTSVITVIRRISKVREMYFAGIRIRSAVVAVAVAATLVGCNYRAKSAAKTPVPLSTNPYSQDDYKTDRREYQKAQPDEMKMKWRNQIVLKAMRTIDLRYYWMEQDLLNSRASTGLAFDVLKLSGAALGTVSNGARGKSIISAVLAGVVGTEIAADKNSFRTRA